MNHRGENRLTKKIDARVELQMLPEFVQFFLIETFGNIDVAFNLVFFIFFVTISFVFALVYLRRFQLTNEFRKLSQKLQQEQNQLELKCSTLENLNEKFSAELEELKEKVLPNLSEENIELRENIVEMEKNCGEFRTRAENESKELEKQRKIVAKLNDEILRFQDDLAKERTIVARFRSTDCSIERFENDQKLIEQLRREIRRFEEEKSVEFDRHEEIQIEKNGESFRHVFEELEEQLRLETQRRRDFEMKLNVVLELRERDAQIHLRQIGNFDAQWRQAKSDVERLQIVQTQLKLREKQIEKLQEESTIEKNRWLEDSQKLENDLHDKSMEIKRLAREMDLMRKESESFRKKIAQQTIVFERTNEEKKRLELMIEDLRKTSPISTPSSQNDDHSYQHFRPISNENSRCFIGPPVLFRPRFLPVFVRPPFPLDFVQLTPKSPIEN